MTWAGRKALFLKFSRHRERVGLAPWPPRLGPAQMCEYTGSNDENDRQILCAAAHEHDARFLLRVLPD